MDVRHETVKSTPPWKADDEFGFRSCAGGTIRSKEVARWIGKLLRQLRRDRKHRYSQVKVTLRFRQDPLE